MSTKNGKANGKGTNGKAKANGKHRLTDDEIAKLVTRAKKFNMLADAMEEDDDARQIDVDVARRAAAKAALKAVLAL